MPKLIHEALVQLIRAAPHSVLRLLPSSLGLDALSATQIHITADELVDLNLAELRSDAVVVLGAPDAPIAALITEAQTTPDASKRWTWPALAGGLWSRLRCPLAIVVFTLDEAVAATYRQTIDLGWGLIKVTPIVIGPHNIPEITDLDEARMYPELAVLSAMAHGNSTGGEHIAFAALAAAQSLDNERKLFYPDFIRAALGPITRAALKVLMHTSRERIFICDEFQDAYDRGEAKGEAKILLKLLRLKGLSLSPEQQARIETCTDLGQLDTWAERLLAANTLADVFGPA